MSSRKILSAGRSQHSPAPIVTRACRGGKGFARTGRRQPIEFVILILCHTRLQRTFAASTLLDIISASDETDAKSCKPGRAGKKSSLSLAGIAPRFEEC